MKRLVIFMLALALLPLPASGDELTPYGMEEYRDRTIAGVTGHVAGLLSGFEFVWKDGEPWVPLPEEWFSLLRGPYGNGPTYGGAGVGRILEDGIGSDDDYHIDFFNQLILAERGPLPSEQDILEMWRAYKVSDWGGGDKAMTIMRKLKLAPPYTGLYEYGNIFHWCTEPYIENETLGMNAPGMPQTAWRQADMFARVTGDFESVDWARFWAAVYSMAYTANSAEELLESAKVSLLPGSWPREIIDKCFALRADGTSWEEAVVTIESLRRGIYLCNNIQCAADVNNGFGVLAMLYGGGDWLESVKLASISGYDADCTAATVGGAMGILLGTAGLPVEALDTVWQDGSGKYVNDRAFVAHIGGDYPDVETFGAIAERYISNGLALIEALGGHADGETIYIPMEEAPAWQGLQSENADFEDGSLVGWETDGSAEFRQDTGEGAHSGNGYAAVKLERDAESATLLTRVEGLTPGEWYRLSAYVMTTFDGEARLVVRTGDARFTSSALNANKGWILREVIFQARAESLIAGIEAAQQPDDGGITAYLDDLRVEMLERLERTDVSLEQIKLSRREEASVEFMVPEKGDWALCIYYGNSGTGTVYADASVDGEFRMAAPFPPTSRAEGTPGNETLLPLRLSAGAHTLSLVPEQDGAVIYGISISSWPSAKLNGIID